MQSWVLCQVIQQHLVALNPWKIDQIAQHDKGKGKIQRQRKVCEGRQRAKMVKGSIPKVRPNLMESTARVKEMIKVPTMARVRS